MIPKTIHYCWFGKNPLPKLAIKCIESWRKYLPDYKIIEWNEDNFDVNVIPYTRDAYKEKKYAFVSDYARFWILYHYGGVYFDTDVEVIKFMDDILDKGAFMGCEIDPSKSSDIAVAPGLGIAANPGLGIAANPGLGIYKELLEFYATLSFYKKDGSLNQTTIVKYTTDILTIHGLENKKGIQQIEDILIYPAEYFCPKNYGTGKLIITNKTRTIHHYNESWISPYRKFTKKISKYLDNGTIEKLVRLKRFLLNKNNNI